MGDDAHKFRWVFSRNAATELIECCYWQTGMEEESVFEVQLSDDRVEMKASFGKVGGELRITNVFQAGVISRQVEVTDASGIAILTGKVLHQRKS